MKKFGSIKLGVPDTLNFEGRNYHVKTDSGKISKRKGKPAITMREEEGLRVEPEVKHQAKNKKWGTPVVEVPKEQVYRNSLVNTLNDGDLTVRNKKPSIELITRGERLEVLDKGTQEKVVAEFLKSLRGAPIMAEDKVNIEAEFIKTVKEKGIRAGLKHLLDVVKEIIIMDEEEKDPYKGIRGQIKETEDIISSMKQGIREAKGTKIRKEGRGNEEILDSKRGGFADIKGMNTGEYRDDLNALFEPFMF